MKEIILATNNPGKIAELQAILAPIHCISQQELGIESVEETELSFVENALLKARYMSRLTKKPVLADDSGLIVPALNGAPGIYSARYAATNGSERDNISYLLQQMHCLADAERAAFFYCAIVLVKEANDATPLIALGQLHGLITQIPQGSNGFGYDPVFYLPSHHCTMAELSAAVKNTLSHRAEALKELSRQLAAVL